MQADSAAPLLPATAIQRILAPVSAFIRTESAGGLVLMAAAAGAKNRSLSGAKPLSRETEGSTWRALRRVRPGPPPERALGPDPEVLSTWRTRRRAA